MGVDFSASVVVGVRLADFCEVRTLETTETRYNNRTGNPYQHVEEREAVFIFGVEVPELDPSPSEWEKTLGLPVHDMTNSYEDECDLTQCVAGIEVADSNSHRSGGYSPLSVISQATIDKARAEVIMAIVALRDRLGVIGQDDLPAVQLFLLASVSC